ncbi:hypothetical protein [Nesterenkonia pannonica]|uniref:hypothetical protein n=1 Tax=Nesterenkonia pannonica TaxID=1548602 RepID=UPI00216450E0|nr:hypothetical protein [Nesterenkonia pannonica]
MLTTEGSFQTGQVTRVERHGDRRKAENWLDEVWNQPHTRVLLLREGKVPTLSAPGPDGTSAGALRVLFAAPAGALPEGSIYLGELTNDGA